VEAVCPENLICKSPCASILIGVPKLFTTPVILSSLNLFHFTLSLLSSIGSPADPILLET